MNGRWCPRNLHTVDLHHNTLGPIAVRGRELVWGAAVPILQDFRLETFALSRPCGTDPRLRQMPMKLPSPPLRAVALGAVKLYFATGTAVYQQTLTRPAPPPPVRRSPGYLVPGWPTEVDAALGGLCCRIP